MSKKGNIKRNTALPVAMLGVTTLAGFTLVTTSVSADDVVDQVEITVPVSCTMSGSGMTSHSAELANGTSNSAIGETTINTLCNDASGFAIYAIGFTDDTEGKNVLANATLGSTYDIVTGTGTSGNSQWAMKVTTETSPTPAYPVTIENNFDSFHTVPDDYTMVAKREAATDIGTGATGSTIKTTYQAYIDNNQPAGTYAGQVKYVLVHPHDGAAPEIPVSIDTATTMQEVNSCPDTLPTGQIYTLTDTRDNQDYKVAKLADGKCWMVENLNIAGGTALSADDTDVTSAYISSFTTSNNLTKDGNTIKLPASSTSGFDTDNYSYVYNSGNKTNCGAEDQNTPCYSYYSWDAATLGSGRSISTDNTDAPYSICPKGWHLPNTYNGSGTAAEATDFRALMIALGGSNSIQTYNSSTTPTGATISSALQASPYNFLLAGFYYDGSFYDGGSYGYYWGSTSFSNTSRARNLSFDSSYVLSADSYLRNYGFGVRCLFSWQ